jgi:hypothetical protein
MADPLTATIEFELRGRPGRVVVRYGTNDDPERWGYPLLGLDALVEISRGFPVVQADVEIDVEGYGAELAWIQVVRMTDLDSGESEALVDLAPQLSGLELPYVSFGVRPSFFDAPSTTGRNVDWDAHAFLAVSPDCVMTRRVQLLCGFSWGYRVRNSKPTPVALERLNRRFWVLDLAFLRDQYRSWTFGDAAAARSLGPA